MTRKQVRNIVLVVLLLLLLASLIAYYSYYRSTKHLSFNLAASMTGGAVAPPEFLFSFAGDGNLRMQRPVGVFTYGDKVYVTDGVRHTIYVCNQVDGTQLSTFGATPTVTPLYMARNPKDGLLYVTDRGARKLFKFTMDGQYVGEFNPNLPKNQQPTFKTYGVKWIPVAIAFAPDGTMYVTETLKGDRLLIFGPDGKFKKSVGTRGIAKAPNLAPTFFQFPNGLMIVGNEVYVADSNNGRIQVFDLNGTFKRFIVARGLPRGLAQLGAFPTDTQETPARFVEVDTLSHDATLWTVKGERLLGFGEQGVRDGQFNYPDSVAVGNSNRIYVADTSNGRVDVWGWPAQISPVARLVKPSNAWICLLPLLLIPILFLLRRRRFVATPDFVDAIILAQSADQLPGGRRHWLAKTEHYEVIKTRSAQDINFEDLFEGVDPSESDARAIAEKLEVDKATSLTLALATRAKVFCTEDLELRRLAKLLEVDAIDSAEYIRRYSKKDKSDTPSEKTSAE